MSIGIEIDLTTDPRLKKLIGGLSYFDTRNLLDHVGATIEDQIKVRIRKEKKAPDGSAWKQLDPDYAAWKAGVKPGIGMLEFEGDMRDRVTHNVLGSDAVEIGTSVEYGRYQDSMREFIGLSAENQDEVEAEVKLWFEEVLGVSL